MKYDVIYADSAWRYNFSKSKNRKIENQYDTMTINDICNLPVNNMTNKNAVLYMWATAPKLPEAMKVIDAWGFKYVTHGIWDKEKLAWVIGLEVKRISSVMKEKRGKHSKKPDFIRDLIKEWFPNATRLEMFSREEKQGWHIWGNEVENSIDITTYYN